MGEEKGPEFYTGRGYLRDGAKENNMLIYQEAYELLPKLNAFNKVIDLGCGVGYFSSLIDNENYLGIDFSKDVIKIAKELNPTKTFMVGNLLDENMYNLFYSSNDIYICLEALEHIEKDIEVLKTIPSKCIVIISVPNRDYESHVRYFKNQNEIIERYEDILDFDNCEWRIIETNPKKNAKVFLFKTRRK